MNRQYIKCDACGLTMETKYAIEGMTQEQLKAITKELITRWNTRKPMERIVEQLEGVSFERYGNEGMGGEKVVNFDDLVDVVRNGGKE